MNEEELKKQIKQEIKQELKKEQKKKRRMILAILIIIIATMSVIYIRYGMQRQEMFEESRKQAEQEHDQLMTNALINVISDTIEQINDAIEDLETIENAPRIENVIIQNANIEIAMGMVESYHSRINEKMEEITNNEYLNNIEETKRDELDNLYNKYIKLYNEYKAEQ